MKIATTVDFKWDAVEAATNFNGTAEQVWQFRGESSPKILLVKADKSIANSWRGDHGAGHYSKEEPPRHLAGALRIVMTFHRAFASRTKQRGIGTRSKEALD